MFRNQRNALPASLEDLVQARLLERVPCDPFCEAPFRYHRGRDLVWSVGPSSNNLQPERVYEIDEETEFSRTGEPEPFDFDAVGYTWSVAPPM